MLYRVYSNGCILKYFSLDILKAWVLEKKKTLLHAYYNGHVTIFTLKYFSLDTQKCCIEYTATDGV